MLVISLQDYFKLPTVLKTTNRIVCHSWTAQSLKSLWSVQTRTVLSKLSKNVLSGLLVLPA